MAVLWSLGPLKTKMAAAMAFMDFADKVVLEMNKRNALEPTKRVEITNMNGCST